MAPLGGVRRGCPRASTARDARQERLFVAGHERFSGGLPPLLGREEGERGPRSSAARRRSAGRRSEIEVFIHDAAAGVPFGGCLPARTAVVLQQRRRSSSDRRGVTSALRWTLPP